MPPSWRSHSPEPGTPTAPCSAFGETPEQAVAEVLRAKEAWLAVAAEAGHGIPEPRYRPTIYVH